MKRLVAVLFAAAMTTMAFAQPGPGMGMGFGGGRGNAGDNGPDRPMHRRAQFMAELKLTDDQQAQVQKLRIELEKKQTMLRSKIQIARLEMQELFGAATVDKAAIEKKMKEVSDLQYQEKLNGLDHLFAVKAMLTPEQQKIWAEHMKKAGPEMWERMMQRRMGGR